AVLGKSVLRWRDREPGLAGGHGGQPLPAADRVGKILVIPLLHLRLVVEQVELARPADHVQVDDVLGLGREVSLWQGGVEPGRGPGAGLLLAEERPQGGRAEEVRPAEEEVPAGDVPDVVVEGVHGRLAVRNWLSAGTYLFNTSSRFISSFAN